MGSKCMDGTYAYSHFHNTPMRRKVNPVFRQGDAGMVVWYTSSNTAGEGERKWQIRRKSV